MEILELGREFLKYSHSDFFLHVKKFTFVDPDEVLQSIFVFYCKANGKGKIPFFH